MSGQFMKEFVEIDGHKNGLFIETTDFNHPVLLFLHGGPGFPQYASIKNSNLTWENDFTVCYWEQRGTGMSYNRSTQGEFSMEDLIEDALVITNYLKEKFAQEKIYICGHSWGSFLGSVVVSKYPEHFYAYIGVGQMGRHYESNQHTYDFLLNTAIEHRDLKAEQKIRAVTFDQNFYKNQGYRKILGKYLNRFGGGAKRDGYSNWQGMKELFLCKKYSLKERFNIPKGVFYSYDRLAETLAEADVVKMAPRFAIPVIIVQGLYDYQTSHEEAVRFYEKIEAPIKRFFTFENCAHSPFLEEPERFMQILKRDVLAVQKKNDVRT